MSSAQMWLIASIVLLILELGVPGTFFMVSLALGALTAAGVAWIGLPWWLAWIDFVVVSTIAILASRRIVAHFDRSPSVAMNVDALVGQNAVVIQRIDPLAGSGLVRVKGEEWRAEAEQSLEAGLTVRVCEVRGTKLIVQEVRS